MARILINLGTPPSGQDGDPVRTAFEKVNTMTTELYAGPAGRQVIANPMDNTAGRLLTVGAFGLGGPAVTLPSFDFNGSTILPDGNYYTDAPTNGPGPLGWWNVTNNASAGYQTYEFNSLDGASKWTKVRQGGAIQPWRKISYAGDFGMGTTLGLALPGANAQQALPSARYYTEAQWAGSPYAGLDGRNQGFLDVTVWTDPNYTRQRWSPINPAFGPARTRNSVAGAWQPWIIDVDMNNGLTDPEALQGGLMFRASVSGFDFFKYANGQACLMGGGAQSPQFGANQNGLWDVTIPSLLSGAFIAIPSVSVTPLATWDFSGVSGTLISQTQLRVFVRNGNTPQAFNPLICMWGRWK